MKALLFVCVFACAATGTWAQSSKKKGKKPGTSQPTSVSPNFPAADQYQPDTKKRKKSSGKITYDAQKKYEKQLKEVAKAERRAERELAKPQNSDPSYFGHKRPPKKRPPHKMKLCKECGIRH
jgi:hypothetical protein